LTITSSVTTVIDSFAPDVKTLNSLQVFSFLGSNNANQQQGSCGNTVT
jgi:hypothetical protein